GGSGGGTASVCDPALKPAVVVHESGACPGVMPSPTSCEVQVAACGRLTATHATSDPRGALAIFCSTQDITPSPGYSMYSPASAAFTRASPVGASALGTSSGFLAVSHSVNGTPAPSWLFVNDGGALTASVPQGTSAAFAGPAGVEIAQVSDDFLAVQRYGF